LDDLNEVTGHVARQVNPDQREALMNKLHLVLDNVNATTASLRAEMATTTEGVLLAKVHDALDSVNRGLAEVTGMLEENRPVVHETLLGVERTTRTLEHEIAAPIAAELNRENVRSLLAQLHMSFELINTSLADIQEVSSRARTIVTLNEDRFNRLITDVSETAVHLKSASKDLRRNPWRLFYRPSLEETKQLNIFDAAREFAEAAARLDDSAARLDALIKLHGGQVPADAPELAEIAGRLKETFEDYTQAEEALWKQLDVP
jgi:ABC-type transporter Mla subunit MlaD